MRASGWRWGRACELHEVAVHELDAVLHAVDPRVVARDLQPPVVQIDRIHPLTGESKLNGVTAHPGERIYD